MKPFLKWVGSKRKILPELLCRLPKKYNTYFEPFIGSGTLFLAVRPEWGVISDVNADLITLWTVIRDEPGPLIATLKQLEVCDKQTYYTMRDEFNTPGIDHIRKAAILMFLNRTGFNGLYRVNSAGKFNVPWDSAKIRVKYDTKNLLAVSSALQGVEIAAADYKDVLKRAGSDDFVYIDSPFLETFSNYAGAFSKQDHEALGKVVRDLDHRGALFMLSNSTAAAPLYDGFKIDVVRSMRSVSRDAKGRKEYEEIIVRNYGS
jgi:DNA adenine methylase